LWCVHDTRGAAVWIGAGGAVADLVNGAHVGSPLP
jgi:hypothetical protein